MNGGMNMKDQQVQVVQLLTAGGRTEAQMIVELLKKNGILAHQKSHGAGEFMEIYSAMSFNGYDIYCREEDFVRAKALLEDTGLINERAHGQAIRTYRITPFVRVLAFVLVLLMVGSMLVVLLTI